jgi:hypothetical protein
MATTFTYQDLAGEVIKHGDANDATALMTALVRDMTSSIATGKISFEEAAKLLPQMVLVADAARAACARP